MRKLIHGIIEFRKKQLPDYKETFARLALGQSPDTLFIACSDSRVVPNLFASTNPGDLFVTRNVGNLIPPSHKNGMSSGDKSEAAAIEFALLELKVQDIVVCGHSECGAMQALIAEKKPSHLPNLQDWLEIAHPALEKYRSGFSIDPSQAPHNQLSQVNVLQQLDHLRSYPIIQERVKSGKLRLHGWWFDIRHADVYSLDETLRRMDLIDEEHLQGLLDRLDRPS